MGQQRVRAHMRRMPDGRIVEVSDHKRTGMDRLREMMSPVEAQRKAQGKKRRAITGKGGKKRAGLLSPKRGWRRLRRAWDHARKRRKVTAAVLAVGGVAEIGGFLAARGTGAVLMVVAMGLTALAGGLLAASGGQTGKKKRTPPHGAPPRPPSRGRPPGATRKRKVWEPSATTEEKSFEEKYANTVFEGDDGKKYDVHGAEKKEDAA